MHNALLPLLRNMPNTTNRYQPRQFITPISGRVSANVQIPGSKSLTNRALCLSALSNGVSTLRNTLFSDDTKYFSSALQKLGIEITHDKATATISINGCGGVIPKPEADIFVGNAGTAARFLTAVLSLGNGCYNVDGTDRMRQRPMVELLSALSFQGAQIRSSKKPIRMPFNICGNGLSGGELKISGIRSSQPISALLMVAPFARKATKIQVEGKLVSQPFVKMTVKLMDQFGASVTTTDSHYEIPPAQSYKALDLTIEPDATNASYFFAAAAITAGRIRVRGLRRDSLQGDLGFLDVLERMGCNVQWETNAVVVQGPEKLVGISTDLAAISDTAPTLAAIAPFACSPVEIRGLAHTRLQETDRVHALTTELRRMGVLVDESHGSMRITPTTPHAATIRTYDDHRIAMAFAVTGLRVPGLVIDDPGCTAKTFPDFFTRFEKLSA